VYALREVGDGLGEYGGAAPYIARRDQVAHVDHPGLGSDPGYHSMTGGHIAIFEPVVGEKCDD
jgi:hypothetical protein